MTKTKSTKRALLMSALSLLLCVSMLVGTTFAWFTDSVTSGKNTIQSGNLDVELEYYDGAKWVAVNENTDVFGYDNWEPGYTKLVQFRVTNNGSLALKYQLAADVYSETPGTNMAEEEFLLSKYLYTKVVDANATRADILAITDGANMKDSLSMADGDVLLKGESKETTLAIWMPTTVGNEANYRVNQPKIEFGINLLATQYTYEKDSFDELYDKDAKYPLIATGKKVGDALALSVHLEKDYKVTVEVPENAKDGNYKLVVPPESIVIDETNEMIGFDMHLELDGKKVEPVSGVEYNAEITLDLPHPFVNVIAVLHNGESVPNFDYDATDMTVSFTVDSFSPFKVEYEDAVDYSYEWVYNKETHEISKGALMGCDPADALADGCMVVDFVKDGITYYVVSERATTKIVAAGTATDYVAKYGNDVVAENQSGKLWSLISGLQNNEHSTVYLLPGTYNEATTINVYSSMDIIGLGNKEDIKVVKVKGSYSNRHLFNCNGAITRDDHVQITIRNMTLDASAKNLNSAGKLYTTDNAAVQSIRLSKVKCYDLVIEKSSGFAFYVNGKYDSRGAYMYAENITMETNSVVDTATPYMFYYNDLTYGKGTYSNNTGSIKNITMAADDWDWIN